MKKILRYFVLSSLGLFTIGCTDEDIFQPNPSGTVYENYYSSPAEFEAAITGVYFTFYESGFYSAENGIIKVGDVLSDNVIQNPNGRRTMTTGHNWQYDSGFGAPSAIYSSAYLMIARANAILDNIDNLEDDDFPAKEQIRSEALALRAIAHFEVAKNYIKIPTQSADANSFVGIPYVDVYDPFIEPARLATVADVYDRIIGDLETALPNIPATSINNFRLNRNSMRGIMSRVYLFNGDYDKVIEMAQPVVNAVNPAPKASLQNLWRSVSSEGVLFETLVDNTSPAIGINYSQDQGSNLKAEYTVDKAFVDLFNSSTESERLNASIQRVNTITSGDIFAVRKYIQSAILTGVHRGRYLRVEEVILNLAEAQYLSGDQANALNTLNKLRDARYSSYTGGESGDDLFNAIQLERRKELAFEGDRFFTLKRLQGVAGIPSIHTQGVVRSGNGHLADGTGIPPINLILAPGAREWQFPLTQTHLIRNQNMTQTPGY